MANAINAIHWNEEIDQVGNVYWEGASPYGDEDSGDFFYWRLRRDEDSGVWYEDHDPDLRPNASRCWDRLEDAKAHCQRKHDKIIADEYAG